MNKSQNKNRQIATILGFLQVFIGLGAVGGGLGLIWDPTGAKFGMPLEMLKYSPFSDFLIPGIILLMVNGVGSLIGSLHSFKLKQYASDIAIALGVFLVAWIVIQIYWIHSFHWLHALYLSLGTLEFALGLSLRKVLRNSK